MQKLISGYIDKKRRKESLTLFFVFSFFSVFVSRSGKATKYAVNLWINTGCSKTKHRSPRRQTVASELMKLFVRRLLPRCRGLRLRIFLSLTVGCYKFLLNFVRAFISASSTALSVYF